MDDRIFGDAAQTADNADNNDENKGDNGQQDGDDNAITHEFENIPVRIRAR